MKSEEKEMSFIRIIFKIFPLVFSTCPIYFICINLLAIIHGASHAFNTFVNAKFFESITSAVSLNTTATTVILMAVALGLTAIMVEILNGLHNFMNVNWFNIGTGYLTAKINEKSARINPIAFENTKLLDDINKATEGMNNSMDLISIITTLFAFYLPYFLFMGIYLYTLKPILAVSLILIFIPVLISQLIRSMVFTKFEDKAAPIRREFDYYESCVCSRELFKETRLLGGFSFFKKLYTDSLGLLSKEIWKAEFKTGILELLMKLCTLAGYVGVLFLLVDALVKKEISVGAFAAVFSSVSKMYSIMEEIICRHIGSMTKNLGTVRNFIRFLDLPEMTGIEGEFDINAGIKIQNVSFTYPLSEKSSLNNISLTINNGETIAIVGENGAGKSTLVKIIMGLYLPTKGSVSIGGLDVNTISQQNIFKHISGVFQNYQQYKMTLKENIKISDIESDRDIKLSAQNADVEIESANYPNGLDTVLSKEFDGVDISGGQWQRIAIARGLYRLHNIIVLDEPTSAIDPIEETKIYNKFAEISKDKTSIIVTHRLGSAKIADRIIVLDSGEVVEIGSHIELMAVNGKYSKLWKAQAQYYI